MPMYEYQCRKCGHRFEKIQQFSDDPVKVCPECGGELEKLISRSSVKFKGSGWYVTDYASKGKAASSSETKTDSASKTEASSSESKSDSSKPAPSEKKDKK